MSQIISFIIQNPTSIILFIFGLFFGSFLNVLADRLPREETLSGRSHCESCQHVLAWYDLIPIFSYLSLKGKCRYCHKSFSIEYMIVEILTGVLFLATWIFTMYLFSDMILAFIAVAIVSTLWVMFLSDIRYQILPDEMQIMLFIFSAIWHFVYWNEYINSFELSGYGDILHFPLVGAVIVMIPILLLHILTKGRGMGFGDVKLALNMGFLLGTFSGLLALYIAFVMGGIIGAYLLITKKLKMKSKIAFGPFLIIATFVMFFFQENIVEAIKKLYGF